MIGYTCSPTESMRNLNHFLVDYALHKSWVHQLYFIGSFLQANVKHRSFLKLDSRYVGYFPEYANYVGRPLGINTSMYVMTDSGKFFADVLTNWLIYEVGFNQYKCQMDLYYKYSQRWSQVSWVILCWWLCIFLYIWETRKVVCGYTCKYSPYEIPSICALVYFC